MSKTAVGPEGQELEFPDDATDEEMAAELEKMARSVTVKPHARKKPNQDWRRTGGNIGGMAGGLLGSLGGYPGRTIGATLGGGMGQAFQQAAEMGLNPLSPGALGMGVEVDPGAVGRAMAEQGAFEGIAGGIGKGLSWAGKPLARKVAAQLSANTDEIVRAADQQGIVINATEAAEKAMAPFKTQANAVGGPTADMLKKFFINDFLGNKNVMAGATTAGDVKIMTATEAHAAKEYFESMARHVREAKGGGKFIEPAERQAGQYAKQLADQLRASLNKHVPGYTKVLAEEAKNLRKRKMLQMAARPVAGVAAAVAAHNVPGVKDLPWYIRYGAIPAVAGYAANPALLANIGDLLTNPAFQAWLIHGLAGSARAVNQAANQP